MTEQLDYWQGVLKLPHEHKQLLEVAFIESMTLYPQEKFIVKFINEEEEKKLQQLRLVHGLFRLLHLSNCMNDKLDDVDKIKDMFKIKNGLIKKWGYVSSENRLLFVKEKREVPENRLAIPFTTSLAKASKKSLKELIEYTLNYCDKQNMHGNLGEQEKKYIEIREELEYNRR